MKKLTKHSIKKYIFIAITFIWLALTMGILLIKSRTNYTILIDLFYIQLRQVDILYILCLMICAWCVWILISLWKRYLSRTVRFFIILLWIVLIVGFLYSSLIFFASHVISTYHTFTSPDKKHTLVVEENSFLLSGSVSFYERVNPFFIEDLDADVGLDDGFTPITSEKYWIKWDGNRVHFAVFDARGSRTWTVIKASLGDKDKDVQYEELGVKKNSASEKNHTEEDNNTKDSIQSQPSQQEILDNLSIGNAYHLPNSNYGLIEVDHAMARSLWYFIKFEDDKMIFISEAPDSSPKVEGKVDTKGIIYLAFTDINNNITKYISSDHGRTWKVGQ